MKRIVLIAISIVLVASIVVLCGCEVKYSTSDETTTKKGSTTTTKAEEPTVIVEVTDKDGTVVATEAVTMSANDKEEEKDFFKTDSMDEVVSGVSDDRVQQAIKDNEILSSEDEDSTSDTTTAKPYVQDDLSVLRSTQYMINARLVDASGITQNFKIAKNGKNSSVSLTYNDVPMTIVLGEKNWYMISNVDKTYIEIPRSFVEEQAADDEFGQLILGDPFKFTGEKVSEGKAVEDGVSYTVVSYDNGNKDYLIGKTLIKTVSPDDSIMYYDTISPIAPMSLFEPPEEYKKTIVTSENAGEIASSIDPSNTQTTHNHDHEH